MEHYQLAITAYDRPGSLERILRVIRHRGGKILTMNMQTISAEQLTLSFNLADRNLKSQMINQLTKLADIVAISDES
ncbi:acetolactate synthase 2 small subunit [Orbus sturtevantii]|uniref:ACT domain-containing protein n=1 Tax=Orbus sturtevantii TaxID=3074109 RepID=UPI00370D7CCB